jgi:HK97 gp10 family phage protein
MMGGGGVPRIRGSKEFSRKLARVAGKGKEAEIGRALFVGGEAIQVEAQISITAGAVSGRGHVPSRPGEPPNADTHLLADNIETTQEHPLRVEVSSNAPYAAALEFGTSKMAERPYMRPAVAKTRKEVVALVRGAIA